MEQPINSDVYLCICVSVGVTKSIETNPYKKSESKKHGTYKQIIDTNQLQNSSLQAEYFSSLMCQQIIGPRLKTERDY